MPESMKEDEFRAWVEIVNWVCIGGYEKKDDRGEVWMTPGGRFIDVSFLSDGDVIFTVFDDDDMSPYAYLAKMH